MAETLDECPRCSVPHQLVKLLSTFRTKTRPADSNNRSTGTLTEDFIKDSREELKLQKQELEKKR